MKVFNALEWLTATCLREGPHRQATTGDMQPKLLRIRHRLETFSVDTTTTIEYSYIHASFEDAGQRSKLTESDLHKNNNLNRAHLMEAKLVGLTLSVCQEIFY